MIGAALLPRVTARTQGEGKKGQPQSDFTCCTQSYRSGHPAQVRGIHVLPPPPDTGGGPDDRGMDLKDAAVNRRVLSVPQGGPGGTAREPLFKIRDAGKKKDWHLIPLPASDSAGDLIGVEGDEKLFRECSGSLNAGCNGISAPLLHPWGLQRGCLVCVPLYL